MAINKRITDKIEEEARGDENMLDFLRSLIMFESRNTGRYTKEYEDLLKKYAERDKGGQS